MSLFKSLSLIVSRLSNSFFPLARAISSLARPFSVIKSRVGTIVNPFSFVLRRSFLSSAFLQEKFAVAHGVMVVVSAIIVSGYIHSPHIQFSVFEKAVGINQTGFAHPEGLNFGSRKDNAGNIFLNEFVVEICLFIFYLDIVLKFHALLFITAVKVLKKRM